MVTQEAWAAPGISLRWLHVLDALHQNQENDGCDGPKC